MLVMLPDYRTNNLGFHVVFVAEVLVYPFH